MCLAAARQQQQGQEASAAEQLDSSVLLTITVQLHVQLQGHSRRARRQRLWSDWTLQCCSPPGCMKGVSHQTGPAPQTEWS